jgi:hypothetical protein
MDSLPAQRIETLPGAVRKEAYLKIEALCFLRRHRTHSERQIAEKAGFGSVEAMYHQLKSWGLTGLLPPEKQEEAPKPKEDKPSRKARSSGEPEEVPDARAAAGLFNEAVEELRVTIELLEHHSQVYQGGRFAGAYAFEGSWVLPRSSYSEQRWQELCEQYGQDPDVEWFSIDGLLSSNHPTEAGPYPPRELVVPIAAYALLGRPIEPLLEVLHAKHSRVDVEEIYKLLHQTKSPKTQDGLLRTAQQFAAAVYGHKVGKGALPESPADKEVLAWYITERREAGIADEKIHQDILNSGRELSKKEFTRLANLGRKLPNT